MEGIGLMSRLNNLEPESLKNEGTGSHQSQEINLPHPETGNATTGFEKINSLGREFECSTSLTYVQIVDQFYEECDTWEIETSLGRVNGHSYGTGEPVYFINGAGVTSRFYAPIAWLLRDHYKSVIFDSPLYTPKELNRKNLSIDSLSGIVKDISESQQDSNITIYASSFGTMVALNCLTRYPDTFSRALLQGGYAHRELSFSEKGLSFLGRLFPGKTLAQQVGVISRTDLKNSLSCIKQPVLLIRTEGEGPVLGACQEELEKSLSNVKTEWIHNCGLIPYLSRPHAVAKLIRNYV